MESALEWAKTAFMAINALGVVKLWLDSRMLASKSMIDTLEERIEKRLMKIEKDIDNLEDETRGLPGRNELSEIEKKIESYTQRVHERIDEVRHGNDDIIREVGRLGGQLDAIARNTLELNKLFMARRND